MSRSPSTLLRCAVVGGAALLLGLAPGTAPSASAAANTDRLNPNEQLNPGERLISPNGQYVLVMQGDGNLVEYAPGNRPVWASGTNRANSIVRMQGDGNVVVIAPGNVAVWATGTSGNPNADLELQSDGNIVVYAQGHVARWASGTAGGSSSLTDRIVTIALNQAADPIRSREAGTNCNFYSGAYGVGTPCANGWRAQEWCADFARWVYQSAGARTAGLDSRAYSFRSYGGTWKSGAAASNARVGDAAIYNISGNYASHVGIVTAVSGSQIQVTSGNNSSDRVGTTGWFNPTTSGISGYTSPSA